LGLHTTFGVCLVMAVKTLEDDIYDNEYYAKCIGVPMARLNRLELEVLSALKWRVAVDRDEFLRFEIELLSDVVADLKRGVGELLTLDDVRYHGFEALVDLVEVEEEDESGDEGEGLSKYFSSFTSDDVLHRFSNEKTTAASKMRAGDLLTRASAPALTANDFESLVGVLREANDETPSSASSSCDDDTLSLGSAPPTRSLPPSPVPFSSNAAAVGEAAASPEKPTCVLALAPKMLPLFLEEGSGLESSSQIRSIVAMTFGCFLPFKLMQVVE